jgi:pimeloyl-ACP methyl ester carboxylesterase
MNILRRAREKYGPYIRWKRDLIAELKAGSTVIETDKGPIEYTIHGTSGPYVAIMHGAPGGYDQTEALFSDLFGKGYRILSWSRPGYIRTPLNSGRTFEEQADALASLLDALGIDRAAIIAYSAGGPPALHFAARNPERVWALILESAVSQKYEMNYNNIGENIFFGHLMFNGPSLWLADVIAHHAPMLVGWATTKMESSLDEDEVMNLMRAIMKDEQRLKILMDLIRSMSPPRLRTKGLNNDMRQLKKVENLPFEHVAAPALVIHGTNDFDVPLDHAQKAAGAIHNAEIHIVEGGFHILALSDAAGEIHERKMEFLKRHAPH